MEAEVNKKRPFCQDMGCADSHSPGKEAVTMFLAKDSAVGWDHSRNSQPTRTTGRVRRQGDSSLILGRGPRADAISASEDADIRPSRSEPVPIVTQKKRVGKLQAGASLYANGVFHRSLGQAQASGASLCAAPGNRLAGSAAELKSHQPNAVGRGRNLAARDHCDPRRGST